MVNKKIFELTFENINIWILIRGGMLKIISDIEDFLNKEEERYKPSKEIVECREKLQE
jgi:hypothetical protein